MAWERDTEWRQGNLLDDQAINHFGLGSDDAIESVVIVITHDCDLNQDPANEPDIEVIIGRYIDKLDGNCTHAKNARKLHLDLGSIGDRGLFGEFAATGKKSIAKLELNKFSPRQDACLTSKEKNTLQLWLASRYRRSAFPDEFELRLTKETKLADKISRLVKPHGNFITGVFFDVDNGIEIHKNSKDDVYKLDIMILHNSEPEFFQEAEECAKKVAEDIEREFNEKLFKPKKMWYLIELNDCDYVSESVLTYEQFKQLKRWRLDYISLGAIPPQTVVAE